MKRIIIFVLGIFMILSTQAQLAKVSTPDSILGRKIIRDKAGNTLSWYKPDIAGASYLKVCDLAANFLINSCPVDSATGLPFYLVTCCFNKPVLNGNKYVAEAWPHNPACFYAGCVQSFAIDFYTFSGNKKYLEFVKGVLDYQLEHGTTPAGWKWEKVPYASADPFQKEYQGSGNWEEQGMRGDGLHGIEPDKVGELGYGYLRFYEATNDKKYLEAAINCASALAKNIRPIPVETSPFIEAKTDKSPWPFRVNARTGNVVSEYCSNVLDPIKLFNELLRIKDLAGLDTAQISAFTKAHDIAHNWLFSRSGPMYTYIWNGYFEDIPNDEHQTNRLQITPGEVAKYLIKHPEFNKSNAKDVPALISWIGSVFKTDGYDAIKEQTWCFEPMGSHSARYGSLCALWFEKTGNAFYKNEAYKFLNFATYMTLDDGFVAVGPSWPGAWFSDGYSDYIRHYFDAMAAVPEWAPAGENHVLRSHSVIQNIEYKTSGIAIKTFDNEGSLKCKFTHEPTSVKVGGKTIATKWEALNNGGVLSFSYSNGDSIEIGY